MTIETKNITLAGARADLIDQAMKCDSGAAIDCMARALAVFNEDDGVDVKIYVEKERSSVILHYESHAADMVNAAYMFLRGTEELASCDTPQCVAALAEAKAILAYIEDHRAREAE